MKTGIFRRKARAFFGAAVLFAAAFLAGCKTETSDTPDNADSGKNKPAAPVQFTLSFSAGEHGTLSAAVDGKALTADAKGGAKVEKDKTVTFTAVPANGFGVDMWTLNGGKFLSGGAPGNTAAKLKITADATVKVTFKPLPPGKCTVVMSHGSHGTIQAAPKLPEDGGVAKDTEIIFTAVPARDCKVDAWTVTGGTVLSGGKKGEDTVKVKITKNTTVHVTFSPPPIEYVTLVFSAGEHGKLSAMVGGKPLTADAKSSAKVEKDTVVTFTATAAEGFGVDKWTVKGGRLISGGTDGSALAMLKATQDAKVSVSFKPLPPGKCTVEMTCGANGKIEANPEISPDKTVNKGAEITFTATPAAKYAVDAWKITGGTVLSGGKPGNDAVTVKITKNTTVNVTFKSADEPPPAPEYVTVTFNSGEHGKLSATVDGKALAADAKGGAKVEKGKTVIFTAAPAEGFGVETWTLSGGQFLSGGTAGAESATLKVTADATVKVTFKKLPPGMCTVAMSHGPNGELSASPAIPAGDAFIAKGTVVTFTAKPASGFYVDAWSIAGGELQTGGQDGDDTAKVKITGNTTVNVTFSRYKKVAFGKLSAYLAGASSRSVNYVEVTELTADNVKGDGSGQPFEPSALGKILNEHKGKEVALKFGKMRDELTDLRYCFAGCASLAAAPEIPASVKIMRGCFAGCENLTEAPAIPANVTDMQSCFAGCKKLTKVPPLPASITNMRECFSNCGKLTEAPKIPANVQDMSGCFSSCAHLEQPPAIPGSVKDMSDCFAGCKKLARAPVIPDGVTNMSGCFYNCKKLTQAPKIPQSVLDMSKCFYGCENMPSPPRLPTRVTNMSGCFQGCSSLLFAPEIPSSVKKAAYCFDGCIRLTHAPALPEGITDLWNCFADCKNLIQAPKIPESVQNLTGCFSGCISLTNAPTLPEHITNMRSCFSGCKNLTHVPELPASVTNLYRAFSGCTKLPSVTLKCNYNSETLRGQDSSPFLAFGETFTGCSRLTAGSIKVPAGQLETYKNNAAKMGAQPAWFAAK